MERTSAYNKRLAPFFCRRRNTEKRRQASADITSYSFRHRSSPTGYANYNIYINNVFVGSGSIWITSGSTLQSTGTVNVANAIAGLSGTVTIRLDLFNRVGPGTQGTFRLDDFVLNGYTTALEVWKPRGYRYGFNGMEKDDEVKGSGNSYDFGARMYDARVGRWWSRDKFEASKSYISTYSSFRNNSMLFVDPDGNDEIISIVIKQQGRPDIIIRSSGAISNNVKAGESYWFNSPKGIRAQDYFNFRTKITFNIDENGLINLEGINRNTLTDERRYTEIYFAMNFLAGNDNGAIVSPNEIGWSVKGSGGIQNSGIELYTREGGASPTKQKGRLGVEMTDLESLLDYCTAALKTPANKSQLRKIDVVKEIINNISSAVQETLSEKKISQKKPYSKFVIWDKPLGEKNNRSIRQ